MKKLIAIVLAIVFAAYGSWRQGEKEIVVKEITPQFLKVYNELKLNGEFGNGVGRFYVTPSEEQLLIESGVNYDTIIADLNSHYEGFWNSDVPTGYYSFEKIQSLSDSLATNFPNICKKYVFGQSVSGKEIGALKISDNPELDETEAEIMFDGGIHGDEIGASENCIRFARDILQKYGNEDEITDLIDNREIWIYYCVNPDGRINMQRTNNNGVDLNRDWGFMWDDWGGSTGAYSQPETKALRDCAYNKSFVVHTTYHSGIEYISLPWSYRSDVCPDYDHIYEMATVYANSSTYANMEYGQGNTGMYAINGSSKDTNYGGYGAISWSMEISTDKQPPASQLMPYYNKNYPAMVAMVKHAGYGISGEVTDSSTGEPVKGAIFINDFYPTFTDLNNGDFHKYLNEGTYTITVRANGYEDKIVENISVNELESTFVEIEMDPIEDAHYIYKIASSRIPGNNESDPGDLPALIGGIDERSYSIGKNGWVVFDMLEVVSDGAGPDITIFEGDDSPENYSLFAGETIDGEWKFMGDGVGTQSFDLAVSGLTEARFFKIVDDGDGSQNELGAGFDFDGAKALIHQPGPYIALDGFEIDDSMGNGDGRVDPGEEVTINYTIKNFGDQEAEGVELNLGSDEYISLAQSTFTIPNIGVEEAYSGQFNLTADDNTPSGHNAIVDFAISCNPDHQFQFMIPFKVGGFIVEEYFTTFPGDGWTVVGGNWESGDSDNAGCEAPEAKFNWNPGTVADQYLISPVINTSAYDGLKIEFFHTLDDYGSSGYEIALVSTDDGTNWDTLINFDLEDFTAIEESIIINSELTDDFGSETFQFGFKFSGDSYQVNYWYIDNVMASKIVETDIIENTPKRVSLSQNYPNPFNPVTTISFALPTAQEISLAVYNTRGELVSTLSKGEMKAGNHSVNFDAKALSSGVYYYRLSSDQFTLSRKMVLVK